MARNLLSETAIKALTKPNVYADGDGLYLRVRAGGSKNWLFIYRRGSRRTEIGLGGYGQGTAPVSVKLAREKAETIRQKLARGEDPTSKPEAPAVVTFKDCMDGLLHARRDDWRNEKHKAQYVMTLTKYAEPLHALSVADITIGDVEACLLPHWQERPETADRLRSRIQAVIDFGIARQWRTSANPAIWKGLLDKIMPKRQGMTRGHHAAIPHADLPAVVKRLRTSKGTSAAAVEFLALTAVRTGEGREALWAEFDLDAAVWTIPAERMKSHIEHRVPLTPRVIEILRIRRAASTGKFVFADGAAKAPVSATAMTKALKLASLEGVHGTLHGLRSAFRDFCGDHTEFPREVAEAALAHAVGDRTERAYRRGDALEKRRALMTVWTDYLEGAR